MRLIGVRRSPQAMITSMNVPMKIMLAIVPNPGANPRAQPMVRTTRPII